MKRYGDLWSSIATWPNLLLAASKARRGKRHRGVVQRFEFHLERELLRLQKELESGDYRPGLFRTHWITRPKRRLISAAPYRDRVVHHAVMNVLEPILDRHFHPDSYACRTGKGTHAAAHRLQQLMQRFPYTLQCDVVKFFPSIDHDILKEMFRHRIKDQRVLTLLDTIVDASNEQESSIEWFPGDSLFTPHERRRGLPIGNLTSQWFANWYLTGLDHLVTTVWRIGGYVRYCDDFILLAPTREQLREVIPVLDEQLAGLRLKLHKNRIRTSPSKAGRIFVGFHVKPRSRRLRNAAVRGFLCRLVRMRQKFQAGHLTRDDVQRRLMAWFGHAAQAEAFGLMARLSRGWVIRNGRFHAFRHVPL